MFLFYSNNVEGSIGELTEEELHHCVHVLRNKEGDTIWVTDGKGNKYQATINQIKKSVLRFDISSVETKQKSLLKNCIALSPPKSADRLEFFVEKAIEIGINHIILFESKRTERTRINQTRIDKIAISAMKQSKQLFLPSVITNFKFEQLEKTFQEYEYKYIAHLNGKEETLQKSIIPNKNNLILIGPEGDFTQEEVDHALGYGCVPVSLGENILRTETAGIYAATLLQTIGRSNS